MMIALLIAVLGQFTTQDGIERLRTVPSWEPGQPVILFMRCDIYWTHTDEGRAAYTEFARIGGVAHVRVGNTHKHAWGTAPDPWPFVLSLDVPIWVEINTIETQGFSDTDPNTWHSNHDWERFGITKRQHKLCPGSPGVRRQVARWLEAGQKVRSWGVPLGRIGGLMIHSEAIYTARRNTDVELARVYTTCAYCGNVRDHDAKLTALHAQCVHAFCRGLGAEMPADLDEDGVESKLDLELFGRCQATQDPLGDFNNDGRVNTSDLVCVGKMERPSATTHIPRFWWSSGVGYKDGESWHASPWLPSLDHGPRSDYSSRSAYTTDVGCLMTLDGNIKENARRYRRPHIPWLSATYDGTAKRESVLGTHLSYAKARLASRLGCPMIVVWTLHGPDRPCMTQEIYEAQFENSIAIVHGSRAR